MTAGMPAPSGPTPWLTKRPRQLAAWDANKDVWELYNLESDYSQAMIWPTRNPSAWPR